ncbi:thioredoxin-dependent thiol peroxidase [Echinicola strongylocentroti]|uniref:thioredoxin-dependent peroxiredoxin n=1 Tax=Echinicola strongylocentroti TaxID=1795355 RepID=A0A2Z4INW7_9BACT|nr:thioredoxin-dependent thiol peroxidase [Echinicola strongylocentroti]AWW32477.1 thioredoxin-dependent thiol peroxidase [Echinicola strongylocentroti]
MSLETGNQAPDFEAKDQDGNTIKLSDYKGKKVVLYFYPKDNTPGCTAQACDLRDNYQALLDAGYVVLGISTDSEKSHKKFIEKHELPFPLIADEDKTVHNLYNTWREKKNYGRTYMGTVRTTFVIDEEGNIADIIEKVKTKEHSNQILK